MSDNYVKIPQKKKKNFDSKTILREEEEEEEKQSLKNPQVDKTRPYNCSHQSYLPEQMFTLTMYNYNSRMGQNPSSWVASKPRLIDLSWHWALVKASVTSLAFRDWPLALPNHSTGRPCSGRRTK